MIHVIGWEVSFIIGPDSTLTSKESVLLLGPDTSFTRMGSVPAKRAGYYI